MPISTISAMAMNGEHEGVADVGGELADDRLIALQAPAVGEHRAVGGAEGLDEHRKLRGDGKQRHHEHQQRQRRPASHRLEGDDLGRAQGAHVVALAVHTRFWMNSTASETMVMMTLSAAAKLVLEPTSFMNSL